MLAAANEPQRGDLVRLAAVVAILLALRRVEVCPLDDPPPPTRPTGRVALLMVRSATGSRSRLHCVAREPGREDCRRHTRTRPSAKQARIDRGGAQRQGLALSDARVTLKSLFEKLDEPLLLAPDVASFAAVRAKKDKF